MAKYAQKTKLILQTDTEAVDLSSLCVGMNLPRTPGEVETVQVELAIDRLRVDEHGTLIVYLESE